MGCKEYLHVNRPLVPLKLLMFLVHGGLSALLPFMTLHMKDLGFSPSETSLVLTVLPFVAAVGPPIGGTLADKIGNYRVVFATTALLSVGLHLVLFFAVPISPLVVANITDRHTFQVPFDVPTIDFDCRRGGAGLTWTNPASPCRSFKTVNGMELFHQPQIFTSYCMSDPRPEEESNFCRVGAIVSPSGLHMDVKETLNITNTYCARLRNTTLTCRYRCYVVRNSTWTCMEHAGFNSTGMSRGSFRGLAWAPLSEAKLSNGSNSSVVVVDGHDHYTTLAIYSVLRLVSTTIMWTAIPILDAVGVTMSKQYKAELGRQKMFSQVGFSVMPLVAGALIGVVTKMNGFPDYGPSFYIFAVMHGLAAFLIFTVKVDARLPATNLLKDMKEVLADRRVVSMVFAVFLCGSGFGFNTSFLLWFMEMDLHASKLMLGLSQTAGGIVGIPAMAFAGPLIRKFGHAQILAFSVLLYSPRYMAMAYIPDGQAYWVCATQLMEAISHSLMIVTAADYAGLLSPKYVASLQSFMFAAHYCFGKGAGSLIGGQIYEYYGSRVAFKAFSYAYLGLFFFYVAMHSFFVVRPAVAANRLKKLEDDRKALTGAENEAPEEPVKEGYQSVPTTDVEKNDVPHDPRENGFTIGQEDPDTNLSPYSDAQLIRHNEIENDDGIPKHRRPNGS